MHKSLFNEAIIKLTIEPAGPILIKAGEGASDPTTPDMSFVRTMRNGAETIYLPGSSLKGVLRAHCERLARTVQGSKVIACYPLGNEACGETLKDKDHSAEQIHAKSCFVCRLFGNTSLASHFRTADAYLKGDHHTEERNGIAIDRVFGSTLGGALFNYETVTAGEFQTTLYIKNFTLAQLGLLSLTLRDLTAERIRLGFGKSRGLGAITAHINELTLRYPSCAINAGKLQTLDGRNIGGSDKLIGAGRFIEVVYGEGSASRYGYNKDDDISLPSDYDYRTNEWEEVEVCAPQADGKAQWEQLGRACAAKWKAEVQGEK
jgi:CRISPR-associated RAMP protein (TIGR02581 family)